jgi:glucokinase
METAVLVSPKDFSKSSYTSFFVVADIGGTTTTLAIIGAKSQKVFHIIFKQSFKTAEIDSFENILNNGLREAKEKYNIEISTACLSAAGHLERDRSYIRLTNLDKEIDTRKIIGNTLLARITLLNDLEAVCYGLDTLDLEKDTISLNPEAPKNPDPQSTMAAIGAGTGLGTGIAFFDKARKLHIPLPSEGGQTDFPPANELETELMWFIKKKYSPYKNHQPEFEQVLSGRGLENIYDFLSAKYHPTQISQMISKSSGTEKLELIRENYARDGQCRRSIDMFLGFYARAARNLAFTSCCYSGLFIIGRLALKYKEHFLTPAFIGEFLKHDKMPGLLRGIPLYLITNPDLPLFGCANAANNFKEL